MEITDNKKIISQDNMDVVENRLSIDEVALNYGKKVSYDYKHWLTGQLIRGVGKINGSFITQMEQRDIKNVSFIS